MDKYQLMAIIETLTDLLNCGYFEVFTISVKVTIEPKR